MSAPPLPALPPARTAALLSRRRSQPAATRTAEARFSAYCKGETEFIVTSTHPDSPDATRGEKPEDHIPQLRKDAAATAAGVRFQKLAVVRTEPGSGADEAFVTLRLTFLKSPPKLEQDDAGKSVRSAKAAVTIYKDSRPTTMLQRARLLRAPGGGGWMYHSAESLTPNALGSY